MRTLVATSCLRDRPARRPAARRSDGERWPAAGGSESATPCSPRRARRSAAKTSSRPSRSCRSTGRRRRANGNFNLEGDTEIFLELPDKFRRNESLTLGGGGGTGIDRTEILNGTEFSTEVSGGDFGGRGRGRFGGGFQGAAVARGWRGWQGRAVARGAGTPARISAPQPSERSQQAPDCPLADERHPLPMDRHCAGARGQCRCTGSEDAGRRRHARVHRHDDPHAVDADVDRPGRPRIRRTRRPGPSRSGRS